MAIGSTAMCDSFKVDILSGGHNFNTTNRSLTLNTQDVFKIALFTSASVISNTTANYSAATNEVASGGGYATGGLTTGSTWSITQIPTNGGSSATVAYINFSNAQWTAATFAADGALIYNNTNAGKTVAVLNFGGTKTVSSGTFTIQMPTAGTGSSILQIA